MKNNLIFYVSVCVLLIVACILGVNILKERSAENYLASTISEFCDGPATASYNEQNLELQGKFQQMVVDLQITVPVASLDFNEGVLGIQRECARLRLLQSQLTPEVDRGDIYNEVTKSRKIVDDFSGQKIFDNASQALQKYSEARNSVRQVNSVDADAFLRNAEYYLMQGKWIEAEMEASSALYAAKAAMPTATVEVTTEFFIPTPNAWPTETPIAFPTIAPP